MQWRQWPGISPYRRSETRHTYYGGSHEVLRASGERDPVRAEGRTRPRSAPAYSD